MTAGDSKTAVIKVGGSLYELPDLAARLRKWLSELPTRNILIVPGGGPTANVIRELDRIHGLGEEAAHWLALESLTVNAHFLKRILPHSSVIDYLDLRLPLFRSGALAILDMHTFARDDERRAGALPRTWSVTSDSLAVRVAMVVPADEVVLLKSIDIPDDTSWEEAAQKGWVDVHFPQVVSEVRHELRIRCVNFRSIPPLTKGGQGG